MVHWFNSTDNVLHSQETNLCWHEVHIDLKRDHYYVGLGKHFINKMPFLTNHNFLVYG